MMGFEESIDLEFEFESVSILSAIGSEDDGSANVQMYAVKESTETDGNVVIEGDD